MSDVLAMTNSALTTAGSVLGFVDRVMMIVDSIKAKQLSADNYLRAYYLEVISNMEVLNCINEKNIASVQINTEAFRSFIDKIDTQIGFSILFAEEEDRQGLFDFLKAKGRINNSHKKIVKYRNGVEVLETKKTIYENVLQAISFTVVKIEFLKRFSQCNDEELSLYGRIQMDRRIINIRERFVMIKHVMDDLKAIKELAR